jgi:hypothetical protein
LQEVRLENETDCQPAPPIEVADAIHRGGVELG